MVALVVSILCLALNAFFVAAEFALVKVHVTQLDTLVQRGDRRATAAVRVLGRLDRYLSVTQFGITVASLGLGWIGEPALGRLADAVAIHLSAEPLGSTGHIVVDVLGLGLLTFLHLLLGEMVPKFIAIQYAEATVLRSARALRFIHTAFLPLLWFLELSQRLILRLIGIDPTKANEASLSEEEKRVLRLAGRPVRQIMIRRFVEKSSADHHVPESRDALAVLRELERKQIPYAIVVDEYGGPSGIVTRDDLVEESVTDS